MSAWLPLHRTARTRPLSEKFAEDRPRVFHTYRKLATRLTVRGVEPAAPRLHLSFLDHGNLRTRTLA